MPEEDLKMQARVNLTNQIFINPKQVGSIVHDVKYVDCEIIEVVSSARFISEQVTCAGLSRLST